MALLKDERRFPNFRAKPLSKRIITRVMVVKIGPTAPKCVGETRPKTGPTQIPIIVSRRTSGILVRRKTPVKKWAKKTRIPTNATTGATSCMGIAPYIQRYWVNEG
jgi:hypothetical protein